MKKILYILLLFTLIAGTGARVIFNNRHGSLKTADNTRLLAVVPGVENENPSRTEEQKPDSLLQDSVPLLGASTFVSCKAACADECETSNKRTATAQNNTADKGKTENIDGAVEKPDSIMHEINTCADSSIKLTKDDNSCISQEDICSDPAVLQEAYTDSAGMTENEKKGNILPDSPLAIAVNTDENIPETEKPDTLSIPEYDWPDYHTRERREMTPDIARKYPRGKHVPRFVENTVFGVGESLQYSIDYGFYRAGTATLSVADTEMVNGDVCYRIESKANSNKFISSFYKVRDKVNSYIDIKGLYSRRFEKNLREGGYSSDRYVDFYHDRLIALNTKDSEKVKEIPLYIQDILSSLYNLRTFELKVGKDEFVDVYADGKVYPLRIIIHTIEKIEVPAGEFTCFKVEPVLESEGLFRSQGRLLVWLSFDKYKIPVKMTSKIPIGNIGANLESYTHGDI